jgi:hypothetical protein
LVTRAYIPNLEEVTPWLFRRNRRTGKTDGNPGLTPIDDINVEDRVVDLDPDSDTGRLHSDEEMDDRGAKRRRSSKSGNKKTS